jgi:hypothetical protein
MHPDSTPFETTATEWCLALRRLPNVLHHPPFRHLQLLLRALQLPRGGHHIVLDTIQHRTLLDDEVAQIPEQLCQLWDGRGDLRDLGGPGGEVEVDGYSGLGLGLGLELWFGLQGA